MLGFPPQSSPSSESVCMYVCVWMSLCMNIFMYVCVYARTYVCVYVKVGLYLCVGNFSWLLHASISLNIIIKRLFSFFKGHSEQTMLRFGKAGEWPPSQRWFHCKYSLRGFKCLLLSLGMCFPPPESNNSKNTQFLFFKGVGLPQRRICPWRLWICLAAVGATVLGLATKPCGQTSGRRSLGPPRTAGRHRC